MFTNRTVNLLICCVTTVFVGITIAPEDAECCSPDSPSARFQHPADGQQVPPDVRLHVVSHQQPRDDSFFEPVLTNSDGDRIAVDIPSNYGYSYGWFASMIARHHTVAPEQPLAPGTYSLQFTGIDNPKTTFEVSEELVYPTPPPISSAEWHTRVFDTTQRARNSCEFDYIQQSRVTFPRPGPAEDRHTLFYSVSFTTIGEFDGDTERTGDWSGYEKSVAVIDSPAVDTANSYSLGSIDQNTVTVTTSTRFKPECIEITAIDMTGQRGETLVKCMPNHCAPAPNVNIWEDGWAWFEDIDWSAQPDCSQEYCFTDECDQTGSPDAGATPADAGPDASDAAFGDADTRNDATGATSDAEVDAIADSHSDDRSSTPEAETAANTSEGCNCTAVESSNPVSPITLALAGVFGAAWLLRRRLRCECF